MIVAVDLKKGTIPLFPLLGLGVMGIWDKAQEDPFPYFLLSFLLVPCVLLFLVVSLSFLFHQWAGKEGLGLGDIWLFFACGFWMEMSQIPVFLILGGFLGAISSFYFSIHYFASNDPSAPCFSGGRFPFAPAILISLVFVLLSR